MRKQTGDLQAQIDQLRTALVAAIELQTMQGQLAEYADAAAARRYARDIVALLAAGPRDDTGPPIVPTDVPSYWLPPAVRAVVARTSSDDAEADELVDVARGRDPERTDRFLTLLAGVLRRADLANGLEAQLPRTAKVTSIQRALWTAVAEGRYGDGASDVFVRRLRAAVASTDGRARRPWWRASTRHAWRSVTSGSRGSPRCASPTCPSATSSRCSPKTSRARTTRCGRSRSTSSAGRSWSTWRAVSTHRVTPPPEAKVTVGPSVAVAVTSSGVGTPRGRHRWRYGAIGLAAVAVVLAVIGVIGATAGLLVFAGLVLAAGAACEGAYRWRAVQHTTEVNERLSVVQQRVDAAAGKQAAAEDAARTRTREANSVLDAIHRWAEAPVASGASQLGDDGREDVNVLAADRHEAEAPALAPFPEIVDELGGRSDQGER